MRVLPQFFKFSFYKEKNRAILFFIKAIEFINDKSFRSLTKEGYSQTCQDMV